MITTGVIKLIRTKMDHDARIDVPDQGFAERFFGFLICTVLLQSGTCFSNINFFGKTFAKFGITQRLWQRLNEKSHMYRSPVSPIRV
jgi:hypothetical protein